MILPAAGAVNSLPAAAGQGSGKFNSRTTALIFIKRRWLFIFGCSFFKFYFKVGCRFGRSILRKLQVESGESGQTKIRY